MTEMTKDDYKTQEKYIWQDDRYSFQLKQWITMKLIERFKEINHYFPHEMEDNSLAKN